MKYTVAQERILLSASDEWDPDTYEPSFCRAATEEDLRAACAAAGIVALNREKHFASKYEAMEKQLDAWRPIVAAAIAWSKVPDDDDEDESARLSEVCAACPKELLP